jgi:uncharacterized membrane protein
MATEPEKSRAYVNIRRTFITGIFAFVPLAVTAFIVWWVDDKTKLVTKFLFGREIHFLGVVFALAAIYALGLLVNSIVGKWFLGLADAIIMRLPGIRLFYQAWKQIALTPGGSEGTFSRVVLIPDESGTMKLLGFSSGRLIDGEDASYCVFVPSCPNPIMGRLYFIRADRCQFIEMSTEEAFKVILSTGNYVPPLVSTKPPEVLTSNLV